MVERATVPMHLWVVGLLSLLWNGFGCYQYVMTRTQGAPYVEKAMPGIDGNAVMAYINSFPVYVAAGWAIGVWVGLLGAIFLLMRSRHAVLAFGLSMLGAVLALGWQIANPSPVQAMRDGASTYMHYVVIVVAIALYLYARSQKAKGHLR
jgi:hypothetical protein